MLNEAGRKGLNPLDTLLSSAPKHPRRLVCLTEEPTEVLYRVRPPEARRKPHISSFLDAKFDRILELRPDLVLGFSDLQADLARELIRRGIPVYIFNQRSIAEILQTVRVIGALVDRGEEAKLLAQELEANLRRHADAAALLLRRPRAFFEEWPDPLIAGIRWCSELLELVGAEDVCQECRAQQGAQGRVFLPEEIARRDPEVVIASWCGRKVSRAKIETRPGWTSVSAVRAGQIYEIKSSLILQPGPAALSDGVAELAAIVSAVARGEKLAGRQVAS
jgi:iron complex transport system substrate-binding protein